MKTHIAQLRAVLLLMLTLAPARAMAQSVIAGTVSDSSGGVLPGVTVEVRSPTLIEQVKSAATNEQGQYRVVGLPPGVYQVKFALAGFSTLLREDIALESNFTATIDVQMRVGALEETLTVSAQSPVVDVQTAQRRDVITTRQVLDLPTGRTYSSIGATLPAVTLAGNGHDVGGSNSMQQSNATAYGSTDQAFMIDGLRVDSSLGSGMINLYLDVNDAQEYVYLTSGGTAEYQASGLVINSIGKSGGNVFHGNALGLGSNSHFSALNADATQKANGLVSPPQLANAYDFNFGLGGPLVENTLWFYNSNRAWAVNTHDNMLYNAQESQLGTPGTPVLDDNLLQSYLLRMTWQLNPKNKVMLMYNRLPKWRQYYAIETLTHRPEAAADYHSPNSYITEAKWTSPISSKLLVEAGIALNSLILKGDPQKGQNGPSSTAPYGDIQHYDTVLNIYSNAYEVISNQPLIAHRAAMSLSYVTGAHALKVGYQWNQGYNRPIFDAPEGGRQVYTNGVPTEFDAFATSFGGNVAESDFREQSAYVQDIWTFKRLTLNPGLRYDHFYGWDPPQVEGPGRFVAARTFPYQGDLPKWTDMSLRLGGAYSLLNNGKLAVKGSIGKYVSQQATGFPIKYNPAIPGNVFYIVSPYIDPRNWTDLNGDGVAEDNEIGPSRNTNFGQATNFHPDPSLSRPNDLIYNAAAEYELRPGFGVAFAWNHRSSRAISYTQNLAEPFSNYQLLTVPSPINPTDILPVYQITPGLVAPNNLIDYTSAHNRRIFNGFDFMVHGRIGSGATFTGGTSSGRLQTVLCDAQTPNSLRFCDQTQLSIPYLTTIKLSGSTPVPFGIQVSGVLQSQAGALYTLNYNVTRLVLPQLTTASSVTVPLTPPGGPGSLFLPRVNQLDLSVLRSVRLGKNRVLKPKVELFNLFNANPETSVVSSYPVTYRPLNILNGRLARFGVALEW
jgi:hypothetical protein